MMKNEYDEKVSWTIKKFTSFTSTRLYSYTFIVGGCKWYLIAYPKGNGNSTHFSLFLSVANPKSLPSGWRRHAKYRLTVVNQSSDNLSISRNGENLYDEEHISWGTRTMCPLNEILAKDSGFLLNEELKVVAEVKVLKVIGKSDVTEDISTISITEDVHGFILFTSQAKSVSHMLEKHPEIASDFRPKDPNLRKGYMSLLLSLIETICQLPQQMSKDNLSDAYAALESLETVGFKLDWLEKKLDEVSGTMENKKSIEAGLQEMEKELKDLKHKCSDMEDLVEKKKAKLSALKAPISFDDIVD